MVVNVHTIILHSRTYKMKRVSCIVSYICLVATFIYLTHQVSFSFPDKWQARAAVNSNHYSISGTQSQIFSKFKKAGFVGYLYTDYDIERQRLDELWNATSVKGTPLGNLFADTHLFLNETNYTFFNDKTKGAVCSGPSPVGVAPQQHWDNSTFKGVEIKNGQKVYKFKQAMRGVDGLDMVIYVAIDTMKPIAYEVPKAGRGLLWRGAFTSFLSFSSVSSFSNADYLFQIPSYCNSTA